MSLFRFQHVLLMWSFVGWQSRANRKILFFTKSSPNSHTQALYYPLIGQLEQGGDQMPSLVQKSEDLIRGEQQTQPKHQCNLFNNNIIVQA